MIERKNDVVRVKELIASFPVTTILGPRQCGKTTLARMFHADHYYDLENPRDLAKLSEAQLLLEPLRGLIVIDEIQRKPELFPLLRYLVDTQKKQKYLILGSASRDLIRQGSETLARRIAFYQLGGLSLDDVGHAAARTLWMRGGLPRSFTAKTNKQSRLWLENHIASFLERDIPQLGIMIPAQTLRRFWMMLSHYHGQVIQYAEIGRSFGISDVTVRKYIEILEGTFMVRVLRPWFNNTSKRLVKNPKIFIRDSGIFHTLLAIESHDQLLGHPKLGASWEGFALESVCKKMNKPSEEMFFWATHAGAELDLYFIEKGKSYGVEFKYQGAPTISKSMKTAISDLELSHLYVVYPGKETYLLAKNITVIPLGRFLLGK